ncbi:demethylmenaquinone methyltransferase / 2-methoxy-6-polyprenyl-1,4-benzoquinol methylase [Desulfotomaculum arcticum]|uniref:Demethylmenaquinone methyltransferase / 2-methoxy-6-polyprenyl-1,4-benzoquinol methylase n=1 Tax=Desulfotruncus arcticus DSM 17038 TaxID=1121424 RepID=A0A1I2UM89_9FIRM|nr:class I SAM-dependent methyltransferase [Desulfotruncus arcticus]SFG78148.1 demethylmenaquinone methyltransferase / 2-methoxy-6-polyprenyl-1,4-benzoquinol methylase [Desulfotomaculum arcticum] [Desulfotruncus arcticus DSM 17038]
MSNAEKYLKRLESSNILRESVIRTIVGTLQLPPESKGLDAGCGTGFYTLMLAEAAGVRGYVTGLDIEEKFLAKGPSLASKSGLTERVSFIKGDISNLPFEENLFDWAFSMDLVGYLKIDPVLLLKELARTVKPGGIIYILNWSSQMLLPGYPVLEARLNATSLGIAPFDAKMKPELHSMRALEWFKQAGLSETRAQTFVNNINPPLSQEMRKALVDLFEMRWGEDNPELLEEDQLEYQRLCRDDSPDFILNMPGYYGFFTYSLFGGRVL